MWRGRWYLPGVVIETGLFIHLNLYFISVIMYNVLGIEHGHVTIYLQHTFICIISVSDI